MARRGVLHRDVCAQPGCNETSFTQFDTQRDYREFLQRRNARGDKYRCQRHRDPNANLRPDNLTTTHVVTATVAYGFNGEPLDGLYWYPEGGKTGSGFTFGPGFNAYAEDFPEGTKLVVTARIEIPERRPDDDPAPVAECNGRNCGGYSHG
jgi:hypothetical protein